MEEVNGGEEVKEEDGVNAIIVKKEVSSDVSIYDYE